MGSGNRDNIIFFGTPGLCLPFLESLNQQYNIRLIITQPDRIGGRRKQTIIPAVKEFALKEGIPCRQPLSLKADNLLEEIETIRAKIAVVISYGRLIPARVSRIPSHNTVNVHFSLLPRYRGAAPVQRAIEAGEEQTGITIFQIPKKLDAGDIWSRKEIQIQSDDTSVTLLERMSREGVSFLLETLTGIISGRLHKVPQDHSAATLAPLVQKNEGRINWDFPAAAIRNKFRAFQPWPGLFFEYRDKLFKVHQLRLAESGQSEEPGKILSIDKECLKVSCGQHTAIEIVKFQPEGKQVMTPFAYNLGNPLSGHLN